MEIRTMHICIVCICVLLFYICTAYYEDIELGL